MGHFNACSGEGVDLRGLKIDFIYFIYILINNIFNVFSYSKSKIYCNFKNQSTKVLFVFLFFSLLQYISFSFDGKLVYLCVDIK